MKMTYVLGKEPDGRAFIHGTGEDPDTGELGDYDRAIPPDEMVLGKPARNWDPGNHELKGYTPPDVEDEG